MSSNSSWEQAMKLIINDPRYRYHTVHVSCFAVAHRSFQLDFSLFLKKSLKCPSQTEWEETGLQCLQSTDREGRERGGQNQIQGVKRDISEVLGEPREDDFYHQIQVRSLLLCQFYFSCIDLCYCALWNANNPCHLMSSVSTTIYWKGQFVVVLSSNEKDF